MAFNPSRRKQKKKKREVEKTPYPRPSPKPPAPLSSTELGKKRRERLEELITKPFEWIGPRVFGTKDPVAAFFCLLVTVLFFLLIPPLVLIGFVVLQIIARYFYPDNFKP